MEANWPQLLQDYGPFALLPFALLVIERIAATRAHDKRLPETTRNWVYATAWIMIFVLCGAVVTFWYLNRPGAQEAMMRGSVNGLTLRQQLNATGPEAANVRLFTWRDPRVTSRLYWRTFTTNPLDDKSVLEFLIDSGQNGGDAILSFPFRANRSFFTQSQDLRFNYDANSQTLVFENPVTGKPEEMKGKPIVSLGDASSGAPRVPRLRWFGAVMAQTKLSASAVIANLDADNPLIRLTARKQLATLGPEATKEMDKALASVDSSDRVKLGVIVAANQMRGFRPEAFGNSSWCEVWRGAQSGDQTMKDQASLLLKKRSTPISTPACMELRLKDYQRKTAEELRVYRPASPAKK
jgi:hypothetical protein